MAALLADRHDRRAVRRPDRPADRRRATRSTSCSRPSTASSTSTCAGPTSSGTYAGLRPLIAPSRRLDDHRVARAPGRRRGERPRPGQRRQVHDLPADGRADGRRGARRPRRATRGTADPDGDAAARRRGRPARARRGSRPRSSDRGLDARRRRRPPRRPPRDARRRRSSRSAASAGLLGRLVGRRGPSRGGGRCGRPATSWRSRSTTSWRGGCGSSRSCRTAARRSPRGSPRSSARSSAGTRPARTSEVEPLPRRRAPRVRGRVTAGWRCLAPTWSSPSTRARRALASIVVRPGRGRRRGRPARVRAALPGAGRRPPRPRGDLGGPARRPPARRSRRPAASERIAAIGITNQRETAVVWDRATGRAVADAIVWQSRITAPVLRGAPGGRPRGARPRADRPARSTPTSAARRSARSCVENPGLRAAGRARRARRRDGRVVPDLAADRRPGPRDGRLERVADAPLRHPHAATWDDELLRLMEVPASLLPDVRSCVGGLRRDGSGRSSGGPIPIAGAAGDQQAATFGQACFAPGEAKVTLGTGAFLLANTGRRRSSARRTGCCRRSPGGSAPDAPIVYALEGSVFVTGAAVQWLRDGLGPDRDVGGGRARSPRRCRTAAGSSSCPRSSGSARRTGIPTRAARSSA